MFTVRLTRAVTLLALCMLAMFVPLSTPVTVAGVPVVGAAPACAQPSLSAALPVATVAAAGCNWDALAISCATCAATGSFGSCFACGWYGGRCLLAMMRRRVIRTTPATPTPPTVMSAITTTMTATSPQPQA